jgi:noranthrone monooxygenase
MFTLGKAMGPPLALISAGSFGWAWMRTGEVAYVFATGLTLSILPFTLIVMKRTNDAIADFQGGQKNNGGEAVVVKKLLDRWAVMNYIRALFPLAGGVVGLITALP